MTAGRPARRALIWWLAGLAMALGLGGCANLPFFSSKPAQSDPAPGAGVGTGAGSNDGTGPAATALLAERADFLFEVVAPDALRTLLMAYLDLARFQSAPATDGVTNAELERLMLSAPAQARSLLETEGYFNAEVNVERVANSAGKPLVRMVVQPGARITVAEFKLDAVGDFGAAVQAGDAAAVRELATLRRLWPLQPGQPFRQAAWSTAKSATLARLRAEGYPAANWSGTQATVDTLTNTVRLALTAESGPLFRLGEIRVEGASRYDAEAVRRLATFSPGTPYNEQLLLDFQQRLQQVGLFESVVVDLDPAAQTATATPVLVRVKELPLQQATVGVGYTANTGPRLTVEHTHRRVFGSRWIAKSRLELGPDLQSLEAELTSYPLGRQYRNLLSGGIESLHTTDEIRDSASARIGRTQDTPRIQRLYYAEVVHAEVDSSSYSTTGDAVSANYNWVLRGVDSILLPTRGVTLTAQGALGYARGQRTTFDGPLTTEGNGPFGRAYGRLTWYRPFATDWFATVRAEAGQVFTRQTFGVPDTLLFRAGGDDSVRGYAYRSLGPEVDGTVGSGRVLLTGSVEVARPISASFPVFWWAAFIDAGNAADRWQDVDPAFGYGVGLRWRSPVGPLKLDLAYGQEVRKTRVHLSVGVTF